MNDSISIGEVRKNRGQVLHVYLREYEGRPFVSLECWDSVKGEEGQGVFSGKQYTLSVRTWSDLIPLIEAALKVAEGRWPVRQGRPERRRPLEAEGMDALLDLEAQRRRQ